MMYDVRLVSMRGRHVKHVSITVASVGNLVSWRRPDRWPTHESSEGELFL